MKTFHLTHPHKLLSEKLPKTAASIGFFDGIHKGHQKVIQTAIDYAKKHEMESAVITFHPHPSAILQPNRSEVKYITPLKQKQEILQRMDVDRLYVITFNHELSSLTPQEFIEEFIVGLHIHHLVAGFDFTFGHKGAGNMENIGSMTNNRFTYTTVQKVKNSKEKVSSTKIRKLLKEGNIPKVNHLLGRRLTTSGKVIGGERRVRDLGFPTANVSIDSDTMLPKKGIYAVKAIYKNITYEAIASLGVNPTFTPDSNDLKLEVHILDFEKEIYGEEITLEWYKFIRDEENFPSVDDLIRAMEKDEKEVRKLFQTTS